MHDNGCIESNLEASWLTSRKRLVTFAEHDMSWTQEQRKSRGTTAGLGQTQLIGHRTSHTADRSSEIDMRVLNDSGLTGITAVSDVDNKISYLARNDTESGLAFARSRTTLSLKATTADQTLTLAPSGTNPALCDCLIGTRGEWPSSSNPWQILVASLSGGFLCLQLVALSIAGFGPSAAAKTVASWTSGAFVFCLLDLGRSVGRSENFPKRLLSHLRTRWTRMFCAHAAG